MNLEKYLYDFEKEKIKKTSEPQKLIIIRREAVKRAILGKINTNNSANNWRNKNVVENNSLAYKKFLKEEWFFKENINSSYKIENIKISSKKDIKIYKWILFEVYSSVKNIYNELSWTLVSIDMITSIVKELKDINEKIINNKNVNNLDVNFKKRNRNLINNINKLISLLKESEWDVVDYYTNKAEVIKLFKIILWINKNLLN